MTDENAAALAAALRALADEWNEDDAAEWIDGVPRLTRTTVVQRLRELAALPAHPPAPPEPLNIEALWAAFIDAKVAVLRRDFDRVVALYPGIVAEAAPPAPLPLDVLRTELRAAVVALPRLAGGVNRGEVIDAIDRVFRLATPEPRGVKLDDILTELGSEG